jgi:hypothetical protein
MTRFGKLIGALMLAGTAGAATVATTAPADAHVSVGIGIGVPGPAYGPAYYGNPCYDARYAYYHPGYCGGYAYGPGYYDTGFYGPGYYSPVVGGFWFSDSFGHRHWHGGAFHGGGFHGGGGHWSGGGHHHH